MKCVTEESGGCFKCILDKCVNGAETELETVKHRKLQKVFIILCTTDQNTLENIKKVVEEIGNDTMKDWAGRLGEWQEGGQAQLIIFQGHAVIATRDYVNYCNAKLFKRP